MLSDMTLAELRDELAATQRHVRNIADDDNPDDLLFALNHHRKRAKSLRREIKHRSNHAPLDSLGTFQPLH
jgi:hypothetical protein